MKIENITQLGHYQTVYISPHLDDVGFSCPGLILQEQQTPLSITIFSDSEFEKRKKIFLKRQKEEQVAAEHGKFDFLLAGFCDLRKTKTVSYDGLIWSDVEEKLVDEVSHFLKTVAEQTNAKKFVAPLGVGRHVDHRICYEAVCRVSKNLPYVEVWFYEDRPYAFPPQATEVRLNELCYNVPVDYELFIEELLQTHYLAGKNSDHKLRCWQQHIAEVCKNTCDRNIYKMNCVNYDNHDQIWRIVSSYASQIKFFIGDKEKFIEECQKFARHCGEEHLYIERYWKLFEHS